jgi:tetratricopeptide (TPR) repeat protein
MRTKLSVAAAALIESAYLAAILVVPIFFNIHSSRSFEEDKIPLLRSIAVLIAVTLAVRAFEEGRNAWRVDGTPFWQLPLVRPALVLAIVYCISTLLSVSPYLSVWGSYERTQGTYTWLSYLALFLGIILVVRTRAQVERLVTVVLLSSLPPALYAIVQHFNLDPVRWGLDVTLRAHGTTGNPIFLGAFLVMTTPLTLARLVQHSVRLPSRHGAPPPGRMGTILLVLGYGALALMQVVALAYSQSRGPFVGLAVGLTFLAVLICLQLRQRWLTAAVVAGLLGGGGCIVALNVPDTPLAPLREVRYLDQLGRLFESQAGTGAVRMIIWDGATKLLAARPLRSVIGYGPETLMQVYPPFYPPQLARYESRRVAPDRAHNETFDSLVMTGLVGCAAQLWLWAACLRDGLKHLGLVPSGHARLFYALSGAGAAAGILLPWLIEGSLRLAGVGLPVGLLTGVLASVIAYRFTAQRAAGAPPDLLVAGILAAVVAHVVEIQFGIAVGGTRMLFFVLAAAVVTVGYAGRSDAAGAPEPAAAREGTSHLSLTVSVALVLTLLTFDFYRPNLNYRASALALTVLLLGPWLFGALLVATTAGRRLASVRDYVLLSLAPWALLSGVYVAWLVWQPKGEISLGRVLEVGWYLANVVGFVYAAVFLLIALHAVVLCRGRALPERGTALRGWQLAVCAALVLLAVPVIARTNLDVSRADVFAKQVDYYSKRKQHEAALLVAEEALRLQPAIDQYTTGVVRILMELARGTPRTEAAKRERYLQQAQRVLQQAQQRNPLNMDNIRNQARLHRTWAGLATDAAGQTRHHDEADRLYTLATQLSPNNASLWNEWALLYSERRQPAKVFELLNHSLAIDDGYPTTLWLRANLYLERDELALALADYEAMLAVDPTQLAGWSGKALSLARLNRLDEAIAANHQALKLQPRDFISHRNLAVLYRQTGQPERALAEARAALERAKSPQDRTALEEFIRQLESDGGAH